jgi:quercetin dioxygenase-like cupin family protein
MGRSILTMALAGGAWLIQASPDLPHAFPREGAVQLLDNARVTMWDVTWPKGKPSPMHRHRYDLVGVYLVGSPIRVTLPDGTARESTVEPGFILYQREAVTHIEEGIADIPRHAILTDIKGGPIAAIENPSGQPTAFPREGARQAVDNEKVTIWEYAWTLGKSTGMHFHDKDAFVVFLADGELKSTTPDGKSEITKYKRGDSRFSPRGRVHSEELVSGALRAVITELK